MDVKKQSSKTLAAKVVAFRILGFDKKSAAEAMQELSLRKRDGDDFDFQTYIDDAVKKQPDRPNIGDITKSVQGIFGINFNRLFNERKSNEER